MQKETFEATIPINYSCKKKEKKNNNKKVFDFLKSLKNENRHSKILQLHPSVPVFWEDLTRSVYANPQ